jgi:hypothetical protein
MVVMSISCALLFRGANLSHPIAVCIVGMGGGIYLFYRGFRLLQRRRLIVDTPVSKIRSASMGMVELSGLAVGPYTVIAPITARACYFYRTLVWEYKQCGRNKRWVKVAAECMHVPFFIEDNTGYVMVDPRGAELDLHRDFKQQYCDSFFTFQEEVPASVRALLSRHGVSTTNKVKVEEFCIKPKNALFILGTLGENPGIELSPQPIHDEEYNTLTFGKSLWDFAGNKASSFLGSIRDHGSSDHGSSHDRSSDDGPSDHASAMNEPEGLSISQRLFGGVTRPAIVGIPARSELQMEHATVSGNPQVSRLSANSGSTAVAEVAQQEKIAAALMKAGIANPAAWQAAGIDSSTASGQPSNQTAKSNSASATNSFETNPAVVLRKGENNQAFLISWRSRRDIAKSLAWKCTLMIWGGPALTLLCLYGLLTLTQTIQ